MLYRGNKKSNFLQLIHQNQQCRADVVVIVKNYCSFRLKLQICSKYSKKPYTSSSVLKYEKFTLTHSFPHLGWTQFRLEVLQSYRVL